MEDDDRQLLRGLLTLISDLDRCQHGRHQGDLCYYCEGNSSTGNPHMRPGTVIGYDIGGRRISVPLKREDKLDPTAWRTTR